MFASHRRGHEQRYRRTKVALGAMRYCGAMMCITKHVSDRSAVARCPAIDSVGSPGLKYMCMHAIKPTCDHQWLS